MNPDKADGFSDAKRSIKTIRQMHEAFFCEAPTIFEDRVLLHEAHIDISGREIDCLIKNRRRTNTLAATLISPLH